MKKVKFVINSLLRLLVFDFIFRYIIIPKNEYYIFGLKDFQGQNLFLHNSKYLFLYLSQKKDIKCIWLTDDDKLIEKFKSFGIKHIYKRYDIRGIYYALMSKYWIYDFSNITESISSFLPYKSIKINLWHGIPLKKIERDSPTFIYNRLNSISKRIYELLNIKHDYYIANCEYEAECSKTAFGLNDNAIEILGSPRLDVLYNDIPMSDIFMEKDFSVIKSFKEANKNVIFYVPTFRANGKNCTQWVNSTLVSSFLQKTNSILVCKLHYIDMNNIKKSSDNIYVMQNNSDIYPVLKYSDAIITDYSSIYFDYLLLDKPIIYFPADIENYIKTSGMYGSYDELTAGVKVYDVEELILAMQDVINRVDNYKEDRKVLRDKMFKYQDGKNCERVAEWIRSLDK